MLRPVSQLPDADVAKLLLEESCSDAGYLALFKRSPLEQLIANLRERRGEWPFSRFSSD